MDFSRVKKNADNLRRQESSPGKRRLVKVSPGRFRAGIV